jgi:signal transduction histidine kinase
VERNRIKYFLGAISFGTLASFTAVPLVYGIEWNPILAGLTGFYIVPIAYAILKYELMDIKVVGKRALLYAVLVALSALLLIGVGITNTYVHQEFPAFPGWIIPFVSSIFAVSIGALVWRGMRDVDILKYEFIAVVTHKFRTPITYIKWSLDEFVAADNEAERRRIRERVGNAVSTLSELTGMLIDVARNEAGSYHYNLVSNDLAQAVRDVVGSYSDKAHGKGISVTTSYADRLPNACFDITRIKFAFQILFENAINYSPAGSSVQVHVLREGESLVVSVTDHGIGIAKEDHHHLFNKFFRGANARLVDTEGMGIGLFMARNIIDRHKGRIWAVSEGQGKGSTFAFSIPLDKKG